MIAATECSRAKYLVGGDTKEAFDLVLCEAMRRIDDSILTLFENPGELLNTRVEGDDATGQEGVWNVGKADSPVRLLGAGFAALECGEWDAAVSLQLAAKDKVMNTPPPIGAKAQKDIPPYVDAGLALADAKKKWVVAG